MRSWFDSEPAVDEAAEQLVGQRVLERVRFGGDDERLWADCDLASCAENRLGDTTDPRTIDDTRRADWSTRATTERPRPPSRRKYEHCFWILADRERVGTVALANSTLGGTNVHLSSLYLLPTDRGRGHTSRLLASVRSTLATHGLGLRLDTCWAWQHALSVYLHLGLLVRSWKRDLELIWTTDTTPRHIEIGQTATMTIDIDGKRVELCRAARNGDKLVLESRDDEHAEAQSTFAVALALHGWPLVRSADDWHHDHLSDFGPPEALAHKIAIWEAWDRQRGWRVETPRIPGLAYPTWEELQA